MAVQTRKIVKESGQEESGKYSFGVNPIKKLLGEKKVAKDESPE